MERTVSQNVDVGPSFHFINYIERFISITEILTEISMLKKK